MNVDEKVTWAGHMRDALKCSWKKVGTRNNWIDFKILHQTEILALLNMNKKIGMLIDV